jgi:glycosyltransferase involved in cell wall biosynthesis
MSAKLTALIPCKNERRNIRPCIESVRDIADEILIADSGSTDGTLDLVRKMGDCRIIEREYVNSADFKNWAIPQASHEWILLVDADERVPAKLIEEVQAILADPPSDIDGYWIGRCNHYLGYPIRHCGWNSDDVIRLFRRDASRYATRWVHAEVDLPARRVKRLTTPLSHYTTWNTDEYLYKLNRYANWGAMNIRDEQKHRNKLAIFLRFPMRFLQLYFFRLGILDGIPGLQVCIFTAFYSFLKQAKLWEMEHALQQPDPELAVSAQPASEAATIDFNEARRSLEQAGRPQRQRRAA